MGITMYGAISTNDKQKYRLSFNKLSLKLAINYLLDNCYFTLGSTCFRQLSGTHIGSDPPLLWSTYFCIVMKRSVFFKQKKRHLRMARIFTNYF